MSNSSIFFEGGAFGYTALPASSKSATGEARGRRKEIIDQVLQALDSCDASLKEHSILNSGCNDHINQLIDLFIENKIDRNRALCATHLALLHKSGCGRI